MPHFTAEAKHAILLEYSPHHADRSLAALAQRHGVAGGRRTLQNWLSRWDRTPASLQRKAGGGRPRALTAAQVSRHVRAPILAANRAHRAVHYTTLLPRVRVATGTELSIQTLRRYGKEQLAASQRRTKKRTSAECECNATADRSAAVLCVEQCH